jgi:FixJ family two-component response regulator/GGDEF domain-containing protein
VADKVLFVDDEQGVLDGIVRLLRKEFDVSVALGGQQGLATIQKKGPFAVVISDMRMPGMSGAEFLAQVRRKAPDATRMLLTGQTDMNAAIEAINEGNIFRFLTKPCDKDALVNAINIGIEQHRSITAERSLIKKALIVERSESERAADICQWDNREGPTGLPGPTQARNLLVPLFGTDLQCYVVMLKVPMLKTVEQRYGEEAAGDYLNYAAQYLMQSLRSEDLLFHWGRDVLMAVVRRQISPSAMRMEFDRLTVSNREQVMEVNGKRIMVACHITFDLMPISRFSSLDDMLVAFDGNAV